MKLEILILGNCTKLKDLAPLKSMNKLQKLLIPKDAANINFLRQKSSIVILGYTSEDHSQPAKNFWAEYDKENAQ